MGLFDNINKKYETKPEENVPQFVYGIPDFMKNENVKSEKENIDTSKYEINEEENVPQFVYGIPDEMRKQWEKEEQEEKVIFEGYEGGYCGPSSFYYIVKKHGLYRFKYAYISDGRRLMNGHNSEELLSIPHPEEFYNDFEKEFIEITKDWKEQYYDNNVMDGTQWSYKLSDKNLSFYGSNEFPDNYDTDLIKLLKKYFNTEMYRGYEIKPEDNIPYEVYGTPDSMLNQGMKKNDEPKFKGEKCPHCGSTNLKKYLYGMPASDYDKDNYILGGCEITDNDPQFQCQDCKKDIYRKKSPFSLGNIFKKYDTNPEDNIPQKVYGVPNSIKKTKKETIIIGITGKNSNYTFLINKIENPFSSNKFDSDLIFVGGPLEQNTIGDVSTKLPVSQFDEYANRVIELTQNWKNEIDSNLVKNTSFNIDWNVEYTVDGQEQKINGHNFVPSNWNAFVDYISELELTFKSLKKAELDKINLMNNVHHSNNEDNLNKLVTEKVKDPYFKDLIIKYFNDNFKSDQVATQMFKDVSKYDDIFNEFTKYLSTKSYDYDNQIVIEGYNAKIIHELNPSFEATGVYTFLNSLREKPEWAKKIISCKFPNKDAIPPVKKIITKNDWKIKDMPFEVETFEIDRYLTEEEIKVLSNGHKPKEMEDKWFWYVENNILNIHRSWTGICIYKIELNTTGKLKVIANRNKEEYKIVDINEDIKNVNDLLSYWTSKKYQDYNEEEHALFTVIDPETGQEM